MFSLTLFPAAANTSRLASQIEEAGTSLHNGPFSSGKFLWAEDSALRLKYLNNMIPVVSIKSISSCKIFTEKLLWLSSKTTKVWPSKSFPVYGTYRCQLCLVGLFVIHVTISQGRVSFKGWGYLSLPLDFQCPLGFWKTTWSMVCGLCYPPSILKFLLAPVVQKSGWNPVGFL